MQEMNESTESRELRLRGQRVTSPRTKKEGKGGQKGERNIKDPGPSLSRKVNASGVQQCRGPSGVQQCRGAKPLRRRTPLT